MRSRALHHFEKPRALRAEAELRLARLLHTHYHDPATAEKLLQKIAADLPKCPHATRAQEHLLELGA